MYHIENIWSLDILDLKDYGPENFRRYTYIFIVIDNVSKFGWTDTLKIKNAQKIKTSFESILILSKSKPNLAKTDREKKFITVFYELSEISKTPNIHYSRNSSLGAVLAECCNRTNRDLLR